MQVLNDFLYVLFVASITMSSGQKRSKRLNLHQRYPSNMKSPFQRPGGIENHAVKAPLPRSPDYQRGPPKKSPFTPPSDANKDNSAVIHTTSHPPRQASPKVTTTKSSQRFDGVRNKENNVGPQRNLFQERESPFKPPAPEQWRKDKPNQQRGPATARTFRPGKSSSNHEKKRPVFSKKVESTLERSFPSQRQNLQGIPPLSSIDIKPRRTTGRRRSRPLATPYQDSPGQRDIHDVEPGVTAWTRYTAKPRPSDTGIIRPHSATARCGRQRYSPRKQMCCQGRLVRRQGVRPSCCGTVGYDMVYNNCCGGLVSFRSATKPDC